jgi:hypothetical protein
MSDTVTIGRCKCGGIVYAMIHNPLMERILADDVAQFSARRLKGETVSLEDARRGWKLCHCRKQKRAV